MSFGANEIFPLYFFICLFVFLVSLYALDNTRELPPQQVGTNLLLTSEARRARVESEKKRIQCARAQCGGTMGTAMFARRLVSRASVLLYARR